MIAAASNPSIFQFHRRLGSQRFEFTFPVRWHLARPAQPCHDDTARTATIHRVPDPDVVNLETAFETQWRENLFAAALERIRQKFSLKQYQIFDLIVLKEWPAADVAQSLGVTLANVYVTRHRISAAIKKETRRLEAQFEQATKRHTVKCEIDQTERRGAPE